MTPILMAVDDGLTNGNLNAADVFWLIATALAVIAVILLLTIRPPGDRAVLGSAVGWAAVACIAFGNFLT